MIGEYLQALQMAHRISLSPYDLELLSQISVISLKRMISTFEEKIYDKMHNPKRRTGTPALYKMIPISAKFGKRSHEKPGLIEVDYVEHKGGVNSGRFAITGTYTDIVCGWIVRAAGWGHNLCSIQSIHDTLSPRIYHRPREYHPDNAPALLRCLFDMVQSTQIDRKRMTLKLSRSRPYESNDNAHVEQKNGDKVRNLVGHKRYDQEEQVDILNKIYGVCDMIDNFFIASSKLAEVVKDKHGKVTKRVHDKPQTPYARLMGDKKVSQSVKSNLRKVKSNLNMILLVEEKDTLLKELASTIG
jgi:hypothetical protein